MNLTLLIRSYCSLCRVMEEAVRSAAGDGLDLRIIDIDDDPELTARYDELVPVLLDETGREICRWHFDREAWADYLRAQKR